MVAIGNIQLGDHPLSLAPMEDVTDPSFRYLCKQFGADLLYTEFISSDGLIRSGRKSLKKLEIYDHERPIGIQLYGHVIESMIEATKIAEQSSPEFIDLNFGCPVRKIARRGAGAGMLKDIDGMVRMTSEIVKTTKLPVTVKTRLGWDEDTKNIVAVAERLQDTGIKAITIHARTGVQLYKGKADWSLIGEVKNNPRINIPVFGNGDITGPEVAKSMFEKYGVDGIMIGRATIGRPWIFKEVKHFLEHGEIIPPPSIQEKVDTAKLHFNKSIESKGIPRGIFEMRRHFASYFKGLPDFREIRLRLLTSTDEKEILQILDDIKANYIFPDNSKPPAQIK